MCDNYRLNMSAASFGECMCGRPKADHATGGSSSGPAHS
eukprot:CAMPEP_0119340778 /NCGR_PEP_ID=MMETSP1333-20130426/101010_1 /TAXON_ID=418940 /ORGANISM="Scyphosphaera apsteinii, Strain RCC1455" /LENGTH=38 /DNA_ID= /DNA_START= /DNA_END= /DNA_ORIENTATION=